MALAAVICFLFTGVLSVFQVKNLAADAAKQQESYTEVVSAVPGIDYEALYRSHPAEEVVATVNGEPVLWDEYFYFYCGYVAEVESIMDYYGQHGVPISWEDTYQDGLTWADVPAESAEQSILEYRGIHLFAEENGISLPADAEEQINRQIRESAESLLGEEATEEAFAAYLAKGYLSMPVYRRMLSTNLLYQQVLTELYGDSSEESDVQNAQADLTEKLQQNLENISFVPEETFQRPNVASYQIVGETPIYAVLRNSQLQDMVEKRKQKIFSKN